MFKKFRPHIFKEKTESELREHYENIELEKGDLLAMLIAAIITFAPLIIIISLIYVFIAAVFIA